jgi:hypothetical protein
MTPLPAREWLRARRGLGAAGAALASGVRTIAYLGVSVTAQREGYRPLLHDWFVRRFGLPHRQANAAVGGVGSISSVFLMDELALAQHPALCLVECTTGDMDGKTASHDLAPAVEGIVRKLADHGCEACLVHLFRRDRPIVWTDPVIREYERVADHYGTPSINVGRVVGEDLASGTAEAHAWFRDAVHTTPAGSSRTSRIIVSALDELLSMPPASIEAARTRAYLCPDHYHHCHVAHVSALVNDPAALSSQPFRLTCRYVDVDATRTLSFRSAVSQVKGLFVIIGPSSGRIRVTTPQGSMEYQLKDEWCTYDRLSTVVFDEPLSVGTPVTISPSDGSRLKVVGLLLRDPAGSRDPGDTVRDHFSVDAS